MRDYIVRVGVAISVLFNVIFFGSSNQTFSARNYEWKKKGKFNLVYIIDLIFFFDKNHCMTSWTYWKARQPISKLKKSEIDSLQPKDYSI